VPDGGFGAEDAEGAVGELPPWVGVAPVLLPVLLPVELAVPVTVGTLGLVVTTEGNRGGVGRAGEVGIGLVGGGLVAAVEISQTPSPTAATPSTAPSTTPRRRPLLAVDVRRCCWRWYFARASSRSRCFFETTSPPCRVHDREAAVTGEGSV
jgi:hypothetical protein